MPFVPALQQYIPTGVQLFDLINPVAQNASFAAIAATFTAQSAVTTVTASTQLTDTLRNVLVNVAGASANTSVVITLPVNPSNGDPPCLVEMLATGTAIPANCIVTTSDGSPINSIVLDTVGNTNQPGLYVAGDNLCFVFLGGDLGWLAIGSLSVPSLAGMWAGSGALPWQGQAVAITGAAANVSVEALQSVGASAAVVNNSGGAITAGDATSTFNGTPGPYSFANLTRAAFTCVDTRAFTVTL